MQALRDMDKARAMVNSLDLFSTNESIEDVATRDLMYLLAPQYMSLLLQMAPVDIAIPRSRVVSQALTTSREFLSTCERMRIFPPGTPLGDALERDVHAAAPPPAQREEKIARFRRAKEIRARLEALRSGRLSDESDDASESGEDGEEAREAWMLELELAAQTALDNLGLLKQEADLLEERERRTNEEDELRRRRGEEDEGEAEVAEVVPEQLRVDRMTRDAIQRNVLRPFHNLPTMTLSEFAEREIAEANERAESQRRAESRHRAEEEVDEDGDGERATLKARAWDDWKQENGWIGGWGNRHNRS